MVHNDYYVYIHRRGDNNEVFYVGKGRRYRAKATTGRNRWWHNVVNKCGFILEFVEKGMSEQSAYDLEVETIKFYRDCGHILCNLTDGGEGGSGAVRKQPLIDGTMIDLAIVIPEFVRVKTARWKTRSRLSLNIVLTNLLTTSKMYYNRSKEKADRMKGRRKCVTNHTIIKVLDVLEEKGLITNLYLKELIV